ncbi:AMP-binding protein [Chryseobacterium potabilaquae]|uniref:2-succinylbenzoate--CoA ligase n=1 Tax=Chryseobacterium potabilaquae TaxID=2675057 RepID=A0A6N4X9D6_9FLAO|nr:AMP-binding protein [Chryseobacterium potabilaquae]CAA7197612.1 2-succinylbenzoate--CoA ligase [Chryseobacterium potabilaquae]
MLIDFNGLNISGLSCQTEFELTVKTFLEEWFSDSDTVKVQTSGSTGAPKVFDIPKQKMVNSAIMTCDYLKLQKGDIALGCLPVEYISGKMMIVRSIVRELKLMVVDPSTKPIEKFELPIDFCAMTPLQVENSLEKLYLIKNLIIGGAAVSESLKEAVLKSHRSEKNHIFETYGMSETLSHIGLRQLAPKSEDYFTIFENVDISKDERGCLKIFAPNLNDEILQTNDLVEIINEKQFKFLGRIDHVINSAGVKIFPEQLEALIKKNISNEVVFLGVNDQSLGQKLVLIIEGIYSEDIIEKIGSIEFEKKFHHPKEIIFIDQIPRTPNGKVNRIELSNQISQR